MCNTNYLTLNYNIKTLKFSKTGEKLNYEKSSYSHSYDFAICHL